MGDAVGIPPGMMNSLQELPPLMRRKSERHQSHKLSEDFDWESSWNKRSIMDDEEPVLPILDKMRFK